MSSLAWRSSRVNCDRQQRRAERQLRRTVRRELRCLGIRPPLRIEELCGRLGRHRGREIHLVSSPMPTNQAFGLWIGTSAADYIFYQCRTTRPHQVHIVLHELGHMLADHPSDEAADLSELDAVSAALAGDNVGDDVLTQLMPTLPPEMARAELRRRRRRYDSEEEREAELVATIVREWSFVLDHAAPWAPRHAAGQGVQDALGDRQGWL